jgi:hypothetical protein
MPDFNKVMEVKNRVQNRLLAMPGVHAVGIGPKRVGGKSTGELAIVVALEKKRDLAEIPSYHAIPAEIDGVKTDVIESAQPVSHAGSHEDKRSLRPLRGGTQTQGGLYGKDQTGTVGCIAETVNPALKRIFGFTAWHVVGILLTPPVPPLVMQPPHPPSSPTTVVIAMFNGDVNQSTSAGPKGTIVQLYFKVTQNSSDPHAFGGVFSIFYQLQADNEQIFDVANKIKALVDALPTHHVTVEVPPPSSPGLVAFKVTPDSGFSVEITTFLAFSPQDHGPNDKFGADVTGKTIRLRGEPDGDFWGIYTTIDFSGSLTPTQGVFISAPKGRSLADLAKDLVKALRTLPGVTVKEADGPEVTLTSGDTLECIAWSDVRVGQAENDWGCSGCCNQRIGRVVEARLDVEAGLIQLQEDLEYYAQVEEIGPIHGSFSIPDADASTGTYSVKKRGRSSGLTRGTITMVNAIGILHSINTRPRFYTGAYFVDPTAAFLQFSEPGDSGSALVNDQDQVVGLLFGGPTPPATGSSACHPIAPVLAPFNKQDGGTGIDISSSSTLNEKRTVPPIPPGFPSAMGLAEIPAAAIRDGIERLEREITATADGRRNLEVVRRRFAEVRWMIDHDRRVGVTWQRNHGPQLTRRFLQSLQKTSEPLPEALSGKPIDDCIRDFAGALRRRGRSDLVEDLDRMMPLFLDLGGKDLMELAARMRGAGDTRREGERERTGAQT